MRAILSFCAVNRYLAEEIAKNLSRVGVQFEHVAKDVVSESDFEGIINRSDQSPILLFITDNFLKSKPCMKGALDMLQNADIKSRLIPIIADGIQRDQISGITEMVPTKFEKVSNVIQYMNFWQDEYLKLRKEKRSLEGAALDEVNDKLQNVRRISSETTEFLRMLRGMDHVSYEELKANHFEVFFKRTGFYDSYSEFRQLPLIEVQPLIEQPVIANTPTPEEELATEHMIENIPGISLIKNASDAVGAEEVVETSTSVTDSIVEDTSGIVEELSDQVENTTEIVTEATDQVEDTIEEVVEETVEIPSKEIELESTHTEVIEEPVNSLAEETIESLLENTEEEIVEVEKEAVLGEEILEAEETIVDVIGAPVEKIETIAEDIIEVEYKEPKIEGKLIEKIIDMRSETQMPELKEELEITPEITEPAKTEESTEIIDDLFDDIEEELESETIVAKEAPVFDDRPLEIPPSDVVEGISEEMEEELVDIEETVTESIIKEEVVDIPESVMETIEETLSLEAEALHTEAVAPAIEDGAIDIDEVVDNAIAAAENDTPVDEIETSNDAESFFEEEPADEIMDAIIQEEAVDETAVDDLEQIIHSEEIDKEVEEVQKIYDDVYNKRQVSEWIEAGEYTKAREVLDNIETLEAKMQAAELATIEKDYDAVKANYEKAIEIDGSAISAHYQLANLLIDRFDGMDTKAAHHLKKVIGTELEDEHVLYDYAVILNERLNEPKASINYFKKVLDANAEHPFANYDLAVIYYGMDKSKKAAKHYLKATAINSDLKTNENDEAFQVEKYLKEREAAKAAKTETAQKSSEKVKAYENVALITGATSGIGEQTARILASNGHNLILTGRKANRLAALKAELSAEHNIAVETLKFDIRDFEACKKAVDSLTAQWGNIDLLINNAGLAKGFGSIHEGEVDHWEIMLDTNVKGLLYMTRLISPAMVERKQGHIINVISIAGKYVYPNGTVYCATKHAVDALNKGMRLDLYKHGIRVSGVSPGHVEATHFSLTRYEGNEEKANAVYENFKPLNATDVAETIYFIASRPKHVNVEDITMWGTQQASATMVDRSGREE